MDGVDPEVSSRIFISYRREDSAGHVLALLPALRRHFGSDRIFKDTDNIPPGEDFLKFIRKELDTCSVLLAIIGREWLTIQDSRLKKRRLDNEEDFLRVEVSTALKNERIRVIPVLIERAMMPAAQELPPDLADLQYRNAIELSDIRWESDVQLLIQAIERAAADSAAKPKAPIRPELAELEKRRTREIAGHLSTARDAFETDDFDTALAACEKALLIDPKRMDVLELMDRVGKARDEQRIDGWLREARQAMGQGDFVRASDLIDQALSVDSKSEPALQLRNEMLDRRRERDRERERARALQAAIDRAQSAFDDEDYDTAVRHADDALVIDPDSADAQAVRAKAVAAIEERRKQRELKRRAQQAVSEARAKFSAGEHEHALRLLREFSPAHEIASTACVELEAEFRTIEERRRQAEEEAKQEEIRRAQAEAERAAAERALAEKRAREERERQEAEARRQ
jgi:Tfp pilus assembly protein PilF